MVLEHVLHVGVCAVQSTTCATCTLAHTHVRTFRLRLQLSSTSTYQNLNRHRHIKTDRPELDDMSWRSRARIRRLALSLSTCACSCSVAGRRCWVEQPLSIGSRSRAHGVAVGSLSAEQEAAVLVHGVAEVVCVVRGQWRSGRAGQ